MSLPVITFVVDGLEKSTMINHNTPVGDFVRIYMEMDPDLVDITVSGETVSDDLILMDSYHVEVSKKKAGSGQA